MVTVYQEPTFDPGSGSHLFFLHLSEGISRFLSRWESFVVLYVFILERMVLVVHCYINRITTLVCLKEIIIVL